MSSSSVTSCEHVHGQSPDSMLGRSPDTYLSGFWGPKEFGYNFRNPLDLIPSDMEQLKRAVMAAPEHQVPSVILNANMKLRQQGFTTLIQMCGKRRHWLRAEQVFRALQSYPNLQPNTYTYSALISALSQSGQQKLALHYFDLQVQASSFDQSCVPNQHTYSSAITAAERAVMPEKALEIYEDMKQVGVEPDHVTLSAILQCCQKHSFWQEAAEIVDAMEARGISPSLGQYHTQLKQYASQRNCIEALDLFLSMQQIGQQPTLITCQIALDAFQQGGNAQYALMLLEEMLENKYEVDMACFSSVLRTMSVCGKWKVTRKIYDMLKDAGFVPNAETAKHIINCHVACEESMKDGWLTNVQHEFDQLGLMITLDEDEENSDDILDHSFDSGEGNQQPSLLQTPPP